MFLIFYLIVMFLILLVYGTYKQFLRMSYGSGYGGGSRGFTGPKPVEVGKEYDVEVTEISRQGDGIARVQGFVVFSPRSLNCKGNSRSYNSFQIKSLLGVIRRGLASRRPGC